MEFPQMLFTAALFGGIEHFKPWKGSAYDRDRQQEIYKRAEKGQSGIDFSEWNKTGFNMQLCVLCKSYTSRHEKRPTTAQKWHNTQHVPNRFSFVINLFVGPVVCFVWARNAAHRHKSTVIFLFSVSKTLCQIHADLFYCTVVINLKLDIYYLKVLSLCLFVSRAIRSEPVN